jgi:hypothetical protein
MTVKKTDKELLLEARVRIAELETALRFYAAKKSWVYSLDKCKLEIDEDGGRLTIPAYPVPDFPVLNDYGQTARNVLGITDVRPRSRKSIVSLNVDELPSEHHAGAGED